MSTLEGLRRQIDTAEDLESVVTTMKSLAAVSIRQYERAVEALRDYNRVIEMGFHIVLRTGAAQIENVPAGRTGAVVFGSDQGMCGKFNEEIAGFVHDTFEEEKAAGVAAPGQPGRGSSSTASGRRDANAPARRAGDLDRTPTPQSGRPGGPSSTNQTQAVLHPWKLIAVGTRAEGALLDAGFSLDHTYVVPTSISDVTNLTQELLPRIEHGREHAGLTRLLVFYNLRTGAASYRPQCLQLLPIAADRLRRWRDQPWQSRSLPLFVSDRRELLARLVREYLFVSLYRACAESLASENASRIAAMQAAQQNIEERLDDLQISFHHLRQTAITEALLDVVTGFEALSQERQKAPDRLH
ncbi:MAG TPA: F0F1 ATP synthase subunit gamma [Acidobacteriota bacterium]|nr:F0F1 ATP synthase subunit gamma [Acidobacteriota bacterium]